MRNFPRTIAAEGNSVAKVAVPLPQLAAMIDELKGERVRLEAAGVSQH